MDFQRFLNLVEDAPYAGGLGAAGRFLDLAIGEHVNIQFRTDEFHRLRERKSLNAATSPRSRLR